MDLDEPKIATRRTFLIASGVAAAAGAGAITWAELARSAHRDTTTAPGSSNISTDESILVVVTLYGGNDGLNTVIPLADSAYHDSRPDLAYDAASTLHLDADHGLNPALKGLKALWDKGNLAIVHGVGYPKPDHSHFRSMDIWQTASPAEPIKTGWVGRWLDTLPADPVRAVNLGAVLPPLVVGVNGAASSLQLGRNRSVPAVLTTGVTALGKHDSTDTASAVMVQQSYASERAVTAAFAPLTSTSSATADQGSLNDQLKLVSRAITLGVPTSVYSASLGGFDTHAGEKATQQALLATLDQAVGAFFSGLAGTPAGKRVVMLVYSEFGRRVKANAAQGTDHGTAGPVFVIGAGVKGGHHGEQPSLTDLDDGDLKFSTDFRSVYGEILHKVLRAEPDRILTGSFAPVGFLR